MYIASTSNLPSIVIIQDTDKDNCKRAADGGGCSTKHDATITSFIPSPELSGRSAMKIIGRRIVTTVTRRRKAMPTLTTSSLAATATVTTRNRRSTVLWLSGRNSTFLARNGRSSAQLSPIRSSQYASLSQNQQRELAIKRRHGDLYHFLRSHLHARSLHMDFKWNGHLGEPNAANS
jgi:hypothetical protein